MRISQSRRLDHLLFSGSGPPIGNVMADGVIKERHILRDDPDLRSQGVKRALPNIHTVNEDLAFSRFVESRHQAHKGGLAASAAANERHHFSRGDREINTCKSRQAISFILKGDPFKFQRTCNSRKLCVTPVKVTLILQVQHVKHSHGSRQGLLNSIVRAGQASDRCVGHEHRRQEREKGPGSHRPVNDEIAAVPDDRGHPYHTDNLHVRIRDRRHLDRGRSGSR